MQVATLALLLVCWQADSLDELIKRGSYREAVERASNGRALMRSTVAAGSTHVAGVVHEVVQLRGVFKTPAAAADWIMSLPDRIRTRESLESAGYLYLRARSPRRAIGVLVQAIAKKETGIALTYLGDAYCRTGATRKSLQALTGAAKRRDAPREYLERCARTLAARLRFVRDLKYVGLLATVGLELAAASWLREDSLHDRDRRRARAARKRALGIYRRRLRLTASSARAYWEASTLATGEERFNWLVTSVRKGQDPRDPDKHAVPAALLDLASECAKRNRNIAALALARRRLQIGPCERAWEVIESLPPGTQSPQ